MIRRDFSCWSAAFSEASDGDLRVSGRASEEPLAGVQERLLAALPVAAVAVGRQVHGVRVLGVEAPPVGYAVGVGEDECDGLATTLPGLAVAVHVADCLPIVLGGDGGVAALHGGWRGLDGGIVAGGVALLRELGVGGRLQAVIGPGVGGCCYETGEEVRERFERYAASHGRLLDLKAVATTQLQEAGVAEVEDVGLCTICSEHGRLYSHRRDGAATGRQGGFAWRR